MNPDSHPPVGIDTDPVGFDLRRETARKFGESAMKTKLWGDKIEQRRPVCNLNPGEKATPLKLTEHARLLDAEPVIQTLHRQLRVFRDFYFDDHQSIFVVYRQQVENLTLRTSPGLDL